MLFSLLFKVWSLGVAGPRPFQEIPWGFYFRRSQILLSNKLPGQADDPYFTLRAHGCRVVLRLAAH
jgi:hypothetical protein